jgi:hypothetical protein
MKNKALIAASFALLSSTAIYMSLPQPQVGDEAVVFGHYRYGVQIPDYNKGGPGECLVSGHFKISLPDTKYDSTFDLGVEIRDATGKSVVKEVIKSFDVSYKDTRRAIPFRKSYPLDPGGYTVIVTGMETSPRANGKVYHGKSGEAGRYYVVQ